MRLFPGHSELPSQIAHKEEKKKKLLTKMRHFFSELWILEAQESLGERVRGRKSARGATLGF